jgi:hypothetical protein
MELFNCLFLAFGMTKIVVINYSLFSLFFNCIWLFLLDKIMQTNYNLNVIIAVYLIFGFINFFFYEGINHFDHYNFLAGAFIYIFLFIYESFKHIKKENLVIFQTNNYLLLFSPIMLMLGLGILMSFNNRTLNSTIVFSGLTLYAVIGYFINFIYYSLIITYCFREKNVKYV